MAGRIAIRSYLAALFLALGLARGGEIVLRDCRELFVDDYLLDRLAGATVRLATPSGEGEALPLDRPWEGRFSGAYISVIKDARAYRMYYRGAVKMPGQRSDSAVVCYAESGDGVSWRKPSLRQFEVAGTLDNNVVIPPNDPFFPADNFSVYYDQRPGVPADRRFKAVAGGLGASAAYARSHVRRGLYRYISADGLHWTRLGDQPLFPDYALDSQNMLTWVAAENCYAIYLRTWTGDQPGRRIEYNSVRTIARSTSADFVHWTEPVRMSFGGTPEENLYTNATQPYFRAPQLLIAMPFRFTPDRHVLTADEFHRFDIDPSMWHGVSDAVLMTTRGGLVYDRKFLESFVRPGLDQGNWAARSNMPGAGIVPIGNDAMSFYILRGYSSNRRRIERMALRLDGFSSLHGGLPGGFAITKPLRISGAGIAVNVATSSVGSLRLAVLAADGAELPGFGAGDAEEIAGDFIDRPLRWKSGRTIPSLEGKVVRLKFSISDADLYSFRVYSNQ